MRIDLYGYGAWRDAPWVFHAQWGALFILIKGVTPIPSKLVTIVSGLLGYNFALFVLLSLVARGGRSFIMAALLGRNGVPIKVVLDRRFAPIMIGFVVTVGLGFWVVTKWI